MAFTENAKAYHLKLYGTPKSSLIDRDPEFMEIYENFAYDTVVNYGDLSDRIRMMIVLAGYIGCQGIDDFKGTLGPAMNLGVSAYDIKEIVYLSVPYLGIGRAFPFILAVNEFLIGKGYELPLEGQATIDDEFRYDAGRRIQEKLMKQDIRNGWFTGDEDSAFIKKWITKYVYGDHFTRKGIPTSEQAMIAFCFLVAAVGSEKQIQTSVVENMQVGNDKKHLINVVAQLMPHIGFPRAAMALDCIDEVK